MTKKAILNLHTKRWLKVRYFSWFVLLSFLSPKICFFIYIVQYFIVPTTKNEIHCCKLVMPISYISIIVSTYSVYILDIIWKPTCTIKTKIFFFSFEKLLGKLIIYDFNKESNYSCTTVFLVFFGTFTIAEDGS